jgi:hypothetical protein
MDLLGFTQTAQVVATDPRHHVKVQVLSRYLAQTDFSGWGGACSPLHLACGAARSCSRRRWQSGCEAMSVS